MRFVLEDESLRTLRLNARVRIGALADVLHALHESLGVGARIRTDGTIELVRAADASKIAPAGATAVL
jgi:ferric-dicitrate binding protein FerR (iron transport regulator)